MTKNWSVTVTRDGEDLLTITSGSISGRNFTPDDEECIRDCGRHLLAFVGLSDDQLPTEDELQRKRRDAVRSTRRFH